MLKLTAIMDEVGPLHGRSVLLNLDVGCHLRTKCLNMNDDACI